MPPSSAAVEDVAGEGALGNPDASQERQGFRVQVADFDGPFDLLLTLIGRRDLDVTELALSTITDEFIAYLKTPGWDLSEASEFVVVAATLLDLKAARLLPQGQVEDAEDIALLEARDLLFARLLQYRAFKDVADFVAAEMDIESQMVARSVSLEPQFAALLPELVMSITPEKLAQIAAKAFAPKPGPPQVSLTHLHNPTVSVTEQAALMVERLRDRGTMTFRALVADAPTTGHLVGRFLAALELFRQGVVAFDQAVPLGELTIRWTGEADRDVVVSDQFDGSDRSEDAVNDPNREG